VAVSVFDMDVTYAVIERPDGSTYTQEIDLYGLINLLETLGEGYEIVDIY